ncbi:SpaA isopeptide-forming pilin-related protein [Phocicoccus pinnipedialis]|nr:SpaA isopeptide-forming pilin-related protein [Jeotgalicoccus pinnipedialis]MBP1940022.1 LPXTG-motif cell wall-anchored protein [Jeotgalicoccus pinnipedialis]
MTLTANQLDQKTISFMADINIDERSLTQDTLKLSLKGDHVLNLQRTLENIRHNGISITEHYNDANERYYLIKVPDKEKHVRIELFTNITDTNVSDYHATLSTTYNGSRITAKDAIYQYITIDGKVSYQNTPKDYEKTPTKITLLSNGVQVPNSYRELRDTANYEYTELRKFDDNLNLIQYDIQVEPLLNYKTEVEDYTILHHFQSTDISGDIHNTSKKGFTLDVHNQDNSKVKSIEISPDDTNYTVHDLPKYSSPNIENDYKVSVNSEDVEVDIDGYNLSISDLETSEEEGESEQSPESAEDGSEEKENETDSANEEEEVDTPKDELEDELSPESTDEIPKDVIDSEEPPSYEDYRAPQYPALSTQTMMGYSQRSLSALTQPENTHVGSITSMSWNVEGLHRNRVPQPVEYEEGYLSKTGEAVENDLNTYTVNVKTQGKKIEKKEPLDIVLVVDNSGSMAGPRWRDMKRDLTTFVTNATRENSTNPNAQVRFAVVNFATNILSGNTTYSNNAATIMSRIPATPSGGTNTQLGLREGEEILKNSTAANKMMIVITDGAPTYSYRARNATGEESLSNFNYNQRLGTGSSFLFGGYSVDGVNVSNHGQAVISEAKRIQNDHPSVPIITIGLDTAQGSSGASNAQMDNVLKKIASDPSYSFNTSNASSELQSVLEEITKITLNSIRSGQINDPIGGMFDLDLGSNNVFDASDYVLTASSPEKLNSVQVSYNNATRTIQLNGLNLGENDWVNISYKVKLRTDSPNFESNVFYPMNGTTTLKPTQGSSQLREYPVPEAKGYFVEFEKLDAKTNEKIEGAEFTLSGNNQTVTSIYQNGNVRFNNLRPGVYILKEKTAPTGYILDTKEYSLKLLDNGSYIVGDVIYSMPNNLYQFKNIPTTYQFEFKKVNDLNEGLSGAEFKLTNKEAATMTQNVTSNNVGQVIFNDLIPGKYTLTEVKAPSGYRKIDYKYEVEILIDGSIKIWSYETGEPVELSGEDITDFKVLNDTQELPNTGGLGTIWIFGLGIMIITYVLYKRRRSYK